MSFALDTSNFPYLSSYASALAHWTKQKPWRGWPEHERPLEKRSKKHCQIVKENDGEIVLRLYSTDLIRFRQDGTTDVYINYGSVSTENFVNAVLRRSNWQFILNRSTPTVWQHERVNDQMAYWKKGYQVDDKWALFDQNWQLVNDKPITTLSIDVKKANAVRKSYGYADFTAWRKAYEAVHPYVQESRWRPAHWRFNNMTIEQVVAALKEGMTAWAELSQKCDDKYILECIYRQHPEIVQKSTRSYFKSTSEWQNAYRLDQKYGWAI